MSSFEIFKQALEHQEATEEENVPGVFRADCYRKWQATKADKVKSTPQDYVNEVFSVITGLNGDHFTQNEEINLIKFITRQLTWPCFQDLPASEYPDTELKHVSFHQRNLVSEPRLDGKEEMKCVTRNDLASASGINPKLASRSTKYLSSYEVFMYFAPEDPNGRSRILSKECFEMWVGTRRNGVKRPEHSFRKALIAHLSGKDGRRPFTQSVENIVLREIRRKETWPCFRNRNESQVVNIGKKGFRHLGFHEAKSKADAGKPPGVDQAAEIANLAAMNSLFQPEMIRFIYNQRQIQNAYLASCQLELPNLQQVPNVQNPKREREEQQDSEVASILASMKKPKTEQNLESHH
eukprot:maker-scaffold_5-snap-gene-4.5-mRNA-1 protein AED:0.01 eAED:0.01 QI:139/1/1/1/0.25/0.2/5/137/351